MDEFEYINNYFKPLTSSIARELRDDAAVYKPSLNKDIVITTDSIVEGIHFFGSEDPKLIAQKALRVNLSDIASMGAKPIFYNLALNIPKSKVKKFIPKFVEGLNLDQLKYNISLIGGDLTSSLKHINITITMFGHLPTGVAVPRDKVKKGDNLYVTGELGLSKIGLENFNSKSHLFLEAKKKYLLPEPRVELGILFRKFVNSMIDISDGLVQDASHLAFNSGLSLELDINSLPIPNAPNLTKKKIIDYALYGGDDYELLFSCDPINEKLLKTISFKKNIKITKIGFFYDSDEKKIKFKNLNKKAKKISFLHF